VGLVAAYNFQGSAQVPPGAADQKEQPRPQVAPDAPVITIEGPCAAGSASPESSAKLPLAGSRAPTDGALAPVSPTQTDSGCKIVVTRAEYETLVAAMHPSKSPWAFRNFATYYADTLLLAERAHESGFDRGPGIQAKGRFGYLEFLGKSYSNDLREKAKVVSDAEVEAYYKEHPEMFEEINLMRVLIPDSKEHNTRFVSPEQMAADKAEMEAEAHKIYKQALAGGNFEKLQEKAYKFADNAEAAPSASMGTRTRNTVPKERREMIFALKVGEVSPLTPENNGWSIFKVVSKRTIPLSEAKKQVQELKAEAAMDGVKNSAKIDLNSDYFTAPLPSEALPPAK